MLLLSREEWKDIFFHQKIGPWILASLGGRFSPHTTVTQKEFGHETKLSYNVREFLSINSSQLRNINTVSDYSVRLTQI